MEISPYQMCITNIISAQERYRVALKQFQKEYPFAEYLPGIDQEYDNFTVSSVLAMALCKTKEDVMNDLIVEFTKRNSQ